MEKLDPITREEIFMAEAAGDSVPSLDPITRKEHFLKRIAENAGSGGGGTGGGANIDIVAEVGQTIIVEEVDTDGKPTKWRAADYPLAVNEIIPQTTYTPVYDSNFGCFIWNLKIDSKPTAGQKYTVIFDGVKYTCVANSGTFSGMSVVYIGNGVMLGNNTGEPFCLAVIDGLTGVGYINVITFDGNEHSLTLSDVKLADDYVPKSARPYYIEISGSGTEADPHVCYDTVANVKAKYKSGQILMARLPTLFMSTTLTFIMPLSMIVTDGDTGKITFGFLNMSIIQSDVAQAYQKLWLVEQDDGTFIVSSTIGDA